MTKSQLECASGWFRAKPARITALQLTNKLCVGSAAAAFFYGVLLRPGLSDPKLTLIRIFVSETWCFFADGFIVLELKYVTPSG